MATSIDLKHHGITIKNGYGFFWGGVLSNWYKCKFKIDSINFSSTEQHMMYNKALLFNDMLAAKEILKTNDPKKVKALGRAVKGFNKAIWDQMNGLIILEGNYEKYIQNENLADILLATGDAELVEASPYDKIYGCGFGVDDPRIIDKSKWTGQNILGKILSDVRSELKLTREMG